MSSLPDLQQGRARIQAALDMFTDLGSKRGMANAQIVLGHISDGMEGMHNFDEALNQFCQVKCFLSCIITSTYTFKHAVFEEWKSSSTPQKVL